MSDLIENQSGDEQARPQAEFDGVSVARGLPNLPGVYRFLGSEEEVLYFRSNDPADLASKIEWSMSNSDLMNKKASNAFEKVLAEFTYEKISLEYKKLYDSLLG